MLTLLKLGGSLITEKNKPMTCRPAVIARLAQEIKQALHRSPGLNLIIGHGSGSYGHVAARKYGTRAGVHDRHGWLGFARVWFDARALNQVVLEALVAAGLPVIAMPPSASAIARDGVVADWNLEPMRAALSAGLIPLVNGDTIFDRVRHGTILSTEDLFFHLAAQFDANRILLAGIEDGVWRDFPTCTQLIPEITPLNFPQVVTALSGSAGVDVTGGMADKVAQMINLVKSIPNLEALIFSGLQAGNVELALAGQCPGTRICSR
ncbi:MAG TPA: isopentenyl phosphate kinase [Levilinea sp.]|nr:isopentenyl phosphate kinase [Levilinea sp.]